MVRTSSNFNNLCKFRYIFVRSLLAITGETGSSFLDEAVSKRHDRITASDIYITRYFIDIRRFVFNLQISYIKNIDIQTVGYRRSIKNSQRGQGERIEPDVGIPDGRVRFLIPKRLTQARR